jgi:hypothetical protein
MRQQKVSHALISVDLILNARKAVALILIDLVIDRPAPFLDGIDYLLRFGLRASRIMPSGKQQQRRFDLIDEVDR